ncbi:MAG: threonine aldolase [Acidimicrobiia bacterium]|nr:threonine aldolase [Acidimicrobiia bacterium]NNF89221.1 threonine aldolase [Acidimicrobiia bacterium]NNL96823.1 threonine aldolase [Acidimicrobiia bacterium]
MADQTERERLRTASRRLDGHGSRSVAELLATTARWCEEHEVGLDPYGVGPFTSEFEGKVAGLLGMPAARFFPSGTMAQQVALRVWTERAGNNHFAMHPTAHLELHEQHGYQHVHGMRATLLGPADEPLLASHFEGLDTEVAALLIELPIREAGGQLPTWVQLEELKKAVAARIARFHLDGARVWESAAFYGRSYAEICAGFDSVYVSFYKGIGALTGAMLLGPEDFIEEAAVWQRRAGGNLYTMAPNVASAAMLLESRLAKMPAYYERAVALVTALSPIEGISILPDPPHTNLMHITLSVDAETAKQRRDSVARDTGLWLFGGVEPQGDDACRFELYIGDAALDLEDDEVVAAFRNIVATED